MTFSSIKICFEASEAQDICYAPHDFYLIVADGMGHITSWVYANMVITFVTFFVFSLLAHFFLVTRDLQISVKLLTLQLDKAQRRRERNSTTRHRPAVQNLPARTGQTGNPSNPPSLSSPPITVNTYLNPQRAANAPKASKKRRRRRRRGRKGRTSDQTSHVPPAPPDGAPPGPPPAKVPTLVRPPSPLPSMGSPAPGDKAPPPPSAGGGGSGLTVESPPPQPLPAKMKRRALGVSDTEESDDASSRRSFGSQSTLSSLWLSEPDPTAAFFRNDFDHTAHDDFVDSDDSLLLPAGFNKVLGKSVMEAKGRQKKWEKNPLKAPSIFENPRDRRISKKF